MLKKLSQKSGQLLNGAISTTGNLISKGVEKTGYDKPAEWIKEASDKAGRATEASLSLTGQVAEGAYKTAKGQFQKDSDTRDDGVDELKGAGKSLVKGIGGFIKEGATSSYETASGLFTKDYDRAKSGAWRLSQLAAVSIFAISVVDILDGADAVQAESVQAMNATLEGDVHPETGVAFERAVVEHDGNVISDVFPVFESSFTAELSTDQYLQTDSLHFKEANLQLASAISDNPSLAHELGLSTTDVQLLAHNITPDGYTWHHHEQPGVLQLVDSEVHNETAHTGGRAIWGGGSDYR